MGYCTAEEVRSMIKDDALNVLIGDEYIDDPAEREAKIQPIIQEAMSDADGEIDGYLAKRYPVPLTQIPKAINKFAKDIAVYNLFSRIGIDENDKEKNYLNRYQSAVKFLQMVAEGKVDIGVGSTQTAASAGFAAQSSPRLFSRGSLNGM
jgi:phage gp36-like protein